MSKELSASAESLSDSRECFIKVYIDNQNLFVIVYNYTNSKLFFLDELAGFLLYPVISFKKCVNWWKGTI